MTRQSWTAVTSAIVFVVLAALLGLLHVPFVAWSPGVTVDLLGANSAGQANVAVTGLKTYPTDGKLLMTTVSETRADSYLSLPEAVLSYLLPHHDVLPRDSVYAPTKTSSQVNDEEVQMMKTGQQSALVAGLRAAGQPVTAMPEVAAVNVNGPSYQRLQPGDLIEKVDGSAVQGVSDVGQAIRKHKVGQKVTFTVLRSGKETSVQVTTVAGNDTAHSAKVGITVDVGYKFTGQASYGIDSSIVGPSAGLMFALAIYDELTSTDVVGGRTIAGTGAIDPEGNVTQIGGIREKIAGAEAAGATAFLVPASNCVDVQGVNTGMRLIKVSTLNDAIQALLALKSSDTAKEVPHC